ncbi:MAG: hypothetical protein RJA57_589 [Bacteroidota bacterium]
MESSLQVRQAERLIFSGLILLLLGLLVGLIIPLTANPRMALSAHLEAIMNGILLLIFGLLWKRLILSKRLFLAAFWLLLYGTFANFLAVILASVTASGAMMPLAGGQKGAAFSEGLITFFLVSLSICMVAGCLIILIGFYRQLCQKKAGE